MKVLHFIESLGNGGAEQVLATLLPHLVEQGLEVHVAVLVPIFHHKERLERAGVTVHLLPSHRKWNIYRGAKQIADLSKKLDIDAIHAHLYFPTIYTGFAKIIKRITAPAFTTYHNLAYAPGKAKSQIKNEFRRFIQRRVSGEFTQHFAVSRASAQHYKDALSLANICVFPNPVNLSNVDAIGETISGESHEPLQLILPGRLVPEKGHGVLIRALSELKHEGLDFRLTFAGEGPLRPKIEAALESEKLKSITTMTGQLEHIDMLAAMQRADIVLVPSIYEGFGLTAAEALALEKPVIASTAGGLVDFIIDQQTGLAFEPGDVAGLKAAILTLSEDVQLGHRLGRNGKKYVYENFSPISLARRLVTIYEEAI